jgi:uncharacterized protein DUF6448
MKREIWVMLATLGLVTWVPSWAVAHCDTLEGPVITTAKAALEKGDVTPVLKWVKADDEASIRDAFQKTMTVRTKGPEAKSMADMYFFETLVRIHRAGEGAPYTGLKSAEPEAAVAGADRALEMGSVDGLITLVTGDVAEGIRMRFTHTLELKKHADESVEKGREFVESYVEFTHYVEALHAAAVESGAHGEGTGPQPESGPHAH